MMGVNPSFSFLCTLGKKDNKYRCLFYKWLVADYTGSIVITNFPSDYPDKWISRRLSHMHPVAASLLHRIPVPLHL